MTDNPSSFVWYELMSTDVAAAGAKPCWIGYIGVEDVDLKARELEKMGGKIHVPPTDIGTIGRFSTLADRQGATFHLFKPLQSAKPTPPSQTSGSNNPPGHIGWRELHAGDWRDAFFVGNPPCMRLLTK